MGLHEFYVMMGKGVELVGLGKISLALVAPSRRERAFLCCCFFVAIATTAKYTGIGTDAHFGPREQPDSQPFIFYQSRSEKQPEEKKPDPSFLPSLLQLPSLQFLPYSFPFTGCYNLARFLWVPALAMHVCAMMSVCAISFLPFLQQDTAYL